MGIRLLTVTFFAFLVTIIVAADTGRGAAVLGPIYAIPLGDKIGHFLLMGGLALLVNLSLQNRTFQALGRQWAVGTYAVLALASLEELSQVALVRRDCSLGDLTADVLGVLLLGGLATRHQVFFPQRSKA